MHGSVKKFPRMDERAGRKSRAARSGIILWAALVAAALIAGAQEDGSSAKSSSGPLVLEVQLDDRPITPGTARFLLRAISEADERNAACLILILDTPGGLLQSTREIVKAILASPTPVVLYVAPSGARAASAGVFITLAAHVAAMAPGTTIGAAHPVQMGGLPIGPPEPPGEPSLPGAPSPQTEKEPDEPSAPTPASVMEEKILNDTVAWVRALAQLRGRNAEWAEEAVTKSVAVTAEEALELNVIDVLAEDVNDLLEKIDGREVRLSEGTIRLKTSGAIVEPIKMWWGERILAAISNPNVAFLLLMFGFYGILFELYSPGWGVAGTLGLVCLLLGFFGMSVLPINYLGLTLMAVAIGLFIAEAFVTSFGALTLGGIVCLVTGGLMLVDSPEGFLRVSLKVIGPVAAATAAIALIVIGGVVRAFRGHVQTGDRAMTESPAVAVENFSTDGPPYHGQVQTHGELWRASSSEPVNEGDTLTVEERRGLTLIVHGAGDQGDENAQRGAT